MVDSTGSKAARRRVESPPARDLETPIWRKPHLCLDEAALEIFGVVASANNLNDAGTLPDLLQDVPGEIEQVSTDDAYDQRRCYDMPELPSGDGGHPARKWSRIRLRADSKAERHARDENLRRVRKVGRKRWKRESGYHRRSLAENQIFCFKTVFSDRPQSRQIDNKFKELLLKNEILNQMARLECPIVSRLPDNKSFKARGQCSCDKAGAIYGEKRQCGVALNILGRNLALS